MKLFSKMQDYNSKLEEVLERKTFSSNVKNLLLSMIYKMEISYKDYKEVKKVVKTQNEFLEEFINIIDNYCDNIKAVEPDTKEANLLKSNKVIALTNEKERSILCYPTENALLFAVSDIIPKYFYIPKEFILKNRFQNLLVNGFNLNNYEILSNFNGWSWDITQNQNMQYVDNLVYQNLLFMLGDKFLTDWRNSNSTKRNFMQELESYIQSVSGSKEYMYKLYSLLYKTASEKEKKKIEVYLKEQMKLLHKMQNKEKFFEAQEKLKSKYIKFVEKIDNILKDEKILIKNLNKLNSRLDEDKKIKTLRAYSNMLKKEKEMYLLQINDISFILDKKNFARKKQELEMYEKLLNDEKSIKEVTLELEKEFLIFLNKKVNLLETREELVNMIYTLRYIRNIPLEKGKLISDIDVLNHGIDRILKKVITKACKMGVMKIISMDISINYEIIKYAFDTRIINLEQIRLSFDIQENNVLVIKVFDKEVFEKQGRKKVENAKDLLEVKINKAIKLFN